MSLLLVLFLASSATLLRQDSLFPAGSRVSLLGTLRRRASPFFLRVSQLPQDLAADTWQKDVSRCLSGSTHSDKPVKAIADMFGMGCRTSMANSQLLLFEHFRLSLFEFRRNFRSNGGEYCFYPSTLSDSIPV